LTFQSKVNSAAVICFVYPTKALNASCRDCGGRYEWSVAGFEAEIAGRIEIAEIESQHAVPIDHIGC
jgi:hypothetical protein